MGTPSQTPLGAPRRAAPADPLGVGVADRRVRRRREPGQDRHQQYRHHRGHGRPYDPVQGVEGGRQGSAARGQQGDEQHAEAPGQAAEQGRHGVDRETDLGVRVRQVAEPVRQQAAADVPDVAEPGDLHAVEVAAARQSFVDP